MNHALRAATILALLITGCNRPPAAAPPSTTAAPAEPPVVTLTTVRPERNTIQRSVSQPGHIYAYEETPLYSKIAGYVQKFGVVRNVPVDKGTRVSRGDVLAELYVPEMKVDVAQKEALVTQAEAELKQAREAVSVAESNFRSAETKVQATEATRLRADAQLQRTQSQFERFTKAGVGGAIDKESIEESRLGVETARAGLAEVKAQVHSAQADQDASKAKWDKSRVDVLVAEAHLEVARKNRDQARTMLDYQWIKAPFDGVVTQRLVDTGHFVQPAAGPGSRALFVVMRTDLMRIRVEVPEAEAGWVDRSATAKIRIPALQSFEYTAKVTRTSWSLDRTAHTLLTEIDVPDRGGQLRPGMYAYATITAERPNVLTLPASAVLTEGDVNQGYRTFCYTVEDGRVWRTPVEIGVRDSQRVEVLRKQARSGKSGEVKWENFIEKEEVVPHPSSGLTDGQPVRVEGPKH